MTRAVDKAYERIRRRIILGEYPPGSHLKEEQIADETGVSRTPVREALRRLGSEQLVKFISNRGAYVANWSADDVDDIFELRTMLEGYAAYRAASRIAESTIRELERCATELEALTAQRSPENHYHMMELNQRFHTLIIDAAQSERLSVMLSWLVEVPMMLRTLETYRDEDLVNSNAHHRELIAALKARDGMLVRKLMESHLQVAHQIYASRSGRNVRRDLPAADTETKLAS